VWTKHLVVSGVLKNVSTSQGTEKRFSVSEIFSTVEPVSAALCLADDACGADMHCDTSVCLSGCAEGQICTAVCYGQCAPGAAQVAGSCQSACGGAAPEKSCYCDAECESYGDCCADYADQCQ
jgi:hypothetical protein